MKTVIAKTITPATERQQILDILKQTPLVEYQQFQGRLFRIEFEQHD